MSQQGQLIRLTRVGRKGEPLWVYRYRLGGRDSARVQRGGFASEDDAAAASATERTAGRLFYDSTAIKQHNRACRGCRPRRRGRYPPWSGRVGCFRVQEQAGTRSAGAVASARRCFSFRAAAQLRSCGRSLAPFPRAAGELRLRAARSAQRASRPTPPASTQGSTSQRLTTRPRSRSRTPRGRDPLSALL